MPREMRMMTERVLQQTALPMGFVLTIYDLPMYSQMMALGGLHLLDQRFSRLKTAEPRNIRIVSESSGKIVVDCGGEHAWIAIPSLIDLMCELTERFGAGQVEILNVDDPRELEVAEGFGRRFGLDIGFTDAATPVLSAHNLETEDAAHQDTVLWKALENGADVPADLWWRIYTLAKGALAPDTVVSRRHAGPVMVTDDGKVIGRADNDDDTDLEFLVRPKINEE
ncbi:hypothetical protein K1W69_10580 [Hoeflea sp. WL0058]|uniref:Uncharacterized protein n=2 Tax=Flavimaribacter sediminis TaxID=2865987 RepID=A0AAE2ZK22_9HYPH|nr:hypothetical protein [Flavimaribacter sediminis]